ncbi:MAG: twin-arginine translocation signal domain-containing protein, partial [Cyclobacteriaceae bacterium]|nr:twin-arginine translocation signal domain-containing protein [Cyclobacteriaceae bacterium]
MKKYWKSIEEKNQTIIPNNGDDIEKSRNTIVDTMVDDMTFDNTASRRDFLKLCGFSLTAATLAASCEAPINKAIPFLIKP